MIQVKPISVNSCWQGRRFATKAFKSWQADVIKQIWFAAETCGVSKSAPVKFEKIYLKIILYLKCPLRSDTDNYLKPIIDCIVKSGWIKDDRYIFQITAEKRQSEREGFDFTIMEFEK